MKNVVKITITSVAVFSLLSTILPLNVNAASETTKFDTYRNSIIQDEINLNNEPNLTSQKADLFTLDSRINKLQNAEIVELNFGSEGELISAESSENGDVESRFIKELQPEGLESSEQNPLISAQSDVSIQSTMPNTSPLPAGASTGAFQRVQTPYSTSQTNSFTGVVADSITLPTYSIENALNTSPTEAAYLYTGIDPGIAEVGLTTTRQTGLGMPAGWYPVFHAKASGVIQVGTGNAGEYYYDSAHKYSSGSVINSYKVYYKYEEKILSIRYLIGTSQIYVVNFPTHGSTGLSVKRVTAIAMNNVSSNTQKFRVPYTTNAVWNNMRFLCNNGSVAKYPSEISSTTEYWNHGGNIDYTKSGTTEYVKIY